LNKAGSGAFSGIIAGINWVVSDASNGGFIGKSVASMSLGGGKVQSLNDAIAAAVKTGIPFVVAGAS